MRFSNIGTAPTFSDCGQTTPKSAHLNRDLSARTVLFVGLLCALASFPTCRVSAQGTVDCDFYQVGIRNGMKFIDGTTFPWTGVTGNGPVTLNGTVLLQQYGLPLNVKYVTVSVNGQPCTVTPDVINPTLECTWTYNGPPITVTGGGAPFALAFEADYNGSLMVDLGVPTIVQYSCNGCVVLSNPNGGLVDNVSVGACSYAGGGIVFPSQPPNATRSIQDNFSITPSTGYTDVSNITVGIIQTVFTYTGTSPGTRLTAILSPSGSQGTFAIGNLSIPPPVWDAGNPANPCYYSPAAQAISSGGVPYIGPTLTLLDSPYITLTGTWPHLVNGIQQSAVWAMLNGINQTAETVSFQDMMSASSPDWPGVTVPIRGYLEWNITFAGSWNPASGVWSGGGSVQTGVTPLGNLPVTDLTKGPSNSLHQLTYVP